MYTLEIYENGSTIEKVIQHNNTIAIIGTTKSLLPYNSELANEESDEYFLIGKHGKIKFFNTRLECIKFLDKNLGGE